MEIGAGQFTVALPSPGVALGGAGREGEPTMTLALGADGALVPRAFTTATVNVYDWPIMRLYLVVGGPPVVPPGRSGVVPFK